MSFLACCVPGCTSKIADDIPLHCFPNPEKDIERFRSWVMNVGGEITGLDNNFIFKNRRVCRKHFVEQWHYTKNRLCPIAVPTLYLGAGPVDQTLNISEKQTQISMDIPLCEATILADLNTSLKGIVEYNKNVLNHNDHNYTTIPDCDDAAVECSSPVETLSETKVVEISVRACRGCLATEPKLYNLYENNLYEAFGEAVGNPIFESDDLPQHICAMCYAQLMKHVSFRGRCLLVQDLLEDLKLQEIAVTTSYIRNIERNKYNLLPNLKQVNTPIDMIIQEELPHEVPLPQQDTELNHKPVEPSAQSSSSLISKKELQDTPLSSTRDDWPEPLSPQGPYEVCSEEPIKSTSAISKEIPKPKKPRKNYIPILQRINIEEFKNKYNMDVKFLTKEERIEELKERILKQSTRKDGGIYCSDCGKCVKSELGLKKHMKLWHDEAAGPNQCDVCRRRYKLDVNNHLCNKVTIKCNKCGVILKGFVPAKSHARKHGIGSAKNYNCQYCKSDFFTNELLRSHLYSSHTDQVLWCKCCGESFLTSGGLNTHLVRVHESSLKYNCQRCTIKFQTSEALDKHSSLTCENFNCVMCGEHFESELVLKDHVVKEHSRLEYIKLACCDGCGVKFYGTDPLVKHLEEKCCGSGHPCLVCGQNFPTSQSLDNHQYENHKLYRACESCDKAFDAHNYRHHMSRVHNLTLPRHHKGMYITTATKLWSVHGSIIKGEETGPSNVTEDQTRAGHLMCHYCGKTFKKALYLRQHTLQHTGERPYICEGCGRGFVKKDQLARHVLLHTGEKPFACHVCSKRFRLRSAFKKHLLCHSDIRRHVCQDCGKSFRTSTSVKLHIKGVHLNMPTRGPRKREFFALNTPVELTDGHAHGLMDKDITQGAPVEPTDGHIQGLMDKDITQGDMVYDNDSGTDTAVTRVIKTIHLKRKRKKTISSMATADLNDSGTQDYMYSEAYKNIASASDKILKKTIKKPEIVKKIKQLKAMANDLEQNYMGTQNFMDEYITQGLMDGNITQENIVYSTLSRTNPATAIKSTINVKQKKFTETSMPSLDFNSETQPEVCMDTHEKVKMDGPSGYNLENRQGFMDTGISIQDGTPKQIILGQQDVRGSQKKYVIIENAANSKIK